MFIKFSHANGEELAIQFVQKLQAVILFPLITLLTVIALIVFLWGAFQFVVKAGDASARSEGTKHMLWGIIGLLVMLSAYAILSIFVNTFGIDPPEPISNFAPVNSVQPTARGGLPAAVGPDGTVPTAPVPVPVARPSHTIPPTLEAEVSTQLSAGGFSESSVNQTLDFFSNTTTERSEKFSRANTLYSNGYISAETKDELFEFIRSTAE